jgi:hypothetical protein
MLAPELARARYPVANRTICARCGQDGVVKR